MLNSIAHRSGPVAALVLLALVGNAQTPTWKAELLGTPPADWAQPAAMAVNDDGLAVGFTYLSGYRRAWIVGPGQALELLPLPAGATWSEALDVNASGVVAGSVLLASGSSRGVLWRPGISGYEVFLLPAGDGGFLPFDARGINDAGEVVGKYGILGGSYHWRAATGTTQITHAVFPDVPYDINEQRQIVAGSFRLDLDTLVLEDLGNPTETPYSYIYTELMCLNDAGQCAGYAVVATSQPPYLAVRYTDGPEWRVFNSFPWTSASASGLAASGDTVFQLGASFGRFVFVEEHGSIPLQDVLAADDQGWDLTDSYNPAISRGGRMACTGINSAAGQSGILLLTPLAFEDLGGGLRGALGTPVLSGFGSLVPGEPTRLRLASAAPNSPAWLSWERVSAGSMRAVPERRLVPTTTDELGRFDLRFPWPSVAPGQVFRLRAFIRDPEAVGGIAKSNVLRAVTQ